MWFSLGVLLSVLTAVAYQAVLYVQKGHPSLPQIAKGFSIAAVEDSINEAWVLEGAPKLTSTQFFRSTDGKVSAGIWEATGPSKFEWHYGTDETVLVLEGGAKLTHDGETTDIGAGNSVFFRAGEVVIWEVPHRIRKTWVLHEPGRVARRLRSVIGD
ncbi:cupin domain-containing protein [Panacagrimonas perspica]|uniref:cupin domain-containing protein n=1 Tax=Panacagrimonas perspica TaxID=381431 RepID=UPI0013C35453|nr:cupin domain-containing protein [Panacagrimonas perspica]